MRFVTAAKVGDLRDGEGVAVEVEGCPIAIFRSGERYFALENRCSHVDAPIADGELLGDRVVCPFHGAMFHVETGAALAPPAQENILAYRCRVEGDDLQIAMGDG